MQFSNILPALSSGQVDAAIATMTITTARKKHFDFTKPYYFATMAAVFKKNDPLHNKSQLLEKKIAVQLGSTMDLWLKKHHPTQPAVAMDNNILAVEALKTGQVDAVLMDSIQAMIFAKKTPSLGYKVFARANDGYGIALPKNSLVTAQFNQALDSLEQKGELKKLIHIWLENNECPN